MLKIAPMNSVLGNRALRRVLSLCGQECKDKLLYGGEKNARLVGITPPISIGRPELGECDGHNIEYCAGG